MQEHNLHYLEMLVEGVMCKADKAPLTMRGLEHLQFKFLVIQPLNQELHSSLVRVGQFVDSGLAFGERAVESCFEYWGVMTCELMMHHDFFSTPLSIVTMVTKAVGLLLQLLLAYSHA